VSDCLVRKNLYLSNQVRLSEKKLEERVIKLGRKGVTTIPKSLRKAAGMVEGSEVRAKVLPYGILLRPLLPNPIETLENLPTARGEKRAVETVRKLRERIDLQTRKKKR